MKSGWVTKKLGEVCEAITSQVRQKDIKYDSGECPIYGASGLITKVGFYQSDTACVGLVKDGAGVGRVMSLPPFSSVIGTMLILRPKQLILNQYLYHLLVQLDLGAGFSGATIPHVYFKDFKDRDISLPPLSEQKRIVKKIDAAFEKIDALKANAEKNLANAKELFQSALDEAMRPKKGWVEKRLGDVATVRVGPFGSSLHKSDYVADGVPLVNPYHMKNSRISDRILTQVSQEKAESLKEYRLKTGDIVFARRGEIGRLAFVSEKEDGYLCGTGSLFARFKEKFEIQFLYFLFSSKSFVGRLEKLSTGTTMKSINSSALESMSFSIPPTDEQKKITNQLKTISQTIAFLQQNYARQIEDCAEMRQAILREAFGGRL